MATIVAFFVGTCLNFRSNARPLNSGLEKNDLDDFNVELSQLFKTVRNLKIRRTLAFEQPYSISLCRKMNVPLLRI